MIQALEVGRGIDCVPLYVGGIELGVVDPKVALTGSGGIAPIG